MALSIGMYAALTAASGVMAALPGGIFRGMNPNEPPAYPHALLHFSEGPSSYSYQVNVRRNGRMQVDFIGRALDCEIAFLAVKQAIDAYNGPLPDGTRIINLQLDGGMESPDPKDPSIIKMSRDFVITYSET